MLFVNYFFVPNPKTLVFVGNCRYRSCVCVCAWFEINKIMCYGVRARYRSNHLYWISWKQHPWQSVVWQTGKCRKHFQSFVNNLKMISFFSMNFSSFFFVRCLPTIILTLNWYLDKQRSVLLWFLLFFLYVIYDSCMIYLIKSMIHRSPIYIFFSIFFSFVVFKMLNTMIDWSFDCFCCYKMW